MGIYGLPPSLETQASSQCLLEEGKVSMNRQYSSLLHGHHWAVCLLWLSFTDLGVSSPSESRMASGGGLGNPRLGLEGRIPHLFLSLQPVSFISCF